MAALPRDVHPESPLGKVRALLRAGDDAGALRIAAKFPRLGAEKDAIQRGAGALTRPEFYRSLGYDPERLIADAYVALRTRFLAEEPDGG